MTFLLCPLWSFGGDVTANMNLYSKLKTVILISHQPSFQGLSSSWLPRWLPERSWERNCLNQARQTSIFTITAQILTRSLANFHR